MHNPKPGPQPTCRSTWLSGCLTRAFYPHLPSPHRASPISHGPRDLGCFVLMAGSLACLRCRCRCNDDGGRQKGKTHRCCPGHRRLCLSLWCLSFSLTCFLPVTVISLSRRHTPFPPPPAPCLHLPTNPHFPRAYPLPPRPWP